MSKFNRILLKLSGESLMGSQSFGIDPVRLGEYAQQIKEVLLQQPVARLYRP